jgi:NAD(P)-dependent dehydrogenase (short-subunit alcohol dehydrogenase family)
MFTPDLLKAKRILVTGGGTGLGKSMSRRFLELGASVVICGRRKNVLEETATQFAAEFSGRIDWCVCDIRHADQVVSMVETIWAAKPLDALVNNAAGNFIAPTETLSPRAIDAILGIVLHGSAYTTLACGKRWLAAGQQATVLSILTTYAWTGSAYVVPSAMAKAGVLAMTRSPSSGVDAASASTPSPRARSPPPARGSGSFRAQILRANSRPAIRSAVPGSTASLPTSRAFYSLTRPDTSMARS